MTKNQAHEWHENRPEGGKRYFRAHFTGKVWTFATTTPDDVDWPKLETPELEVWEALRDVLFRKYQRKRLNIRLLESVDKILARVRAGEEAQPDAKVSEKKGPLSARSLRRKREAQ